ncbi:MAG TPA: enoyl-CoA hydratase-related protein [Candidatus Binatia bacterium]|nr:enoyl-CoA hydratase-related protein [Candidatus Binatia bacterium]
MNIVLTKEDRAAFITLQRPPLNILNLAMLRELSQAVDSIKGDEEVDFLVLRGGGGRAFSAGVDVNDHTRAKVPEMLEAVHSVIRKLLLLHQVTIAVVQGACMGGGCELARSCDLVIASEESFFSTPEINVGCYPPVALARFPSQLGYHRAAEMILTGKKISSREALTIGLVNRVAADADIDHALDSILQELKEKSRAVLRIALKGLREISLKNFSETLQRSEELYLTELLKTEDVEEGVQAFLQKRKPRWNHR